MSKSNDWLPNSREAILAMAHDWQEVFSTKAAAWNIPTPAVQEHAQLTLNAAAALETAKNETTRTPAKRQSLLAWSLAA